MNWIENLLIVAGVSLDIFVYMECQGSLVRRVNKKHLCGICAFVTFSQIVVLFSGILFVRCLLQTASAPQRGSAWRTGGCRNFLLSWCSAHGKSHKKRAGGGTIGDKAGYASSDPSDRNNQYLHGSCRNCIWLPAHEYCIRITYAGGIYSRVHCRRNVRGIPVWYCQ